MKAANFYPRISVVKGFTGCVNHIKTKERKNEKKRMLVYFFGNDSIHPKPNLIE